MNDIVIEDNRIYITKIALEHEMQRFLECRVDVDKIAEHLSKTQVLEEDQSSARTKKKNTIRYYVINRNRLKLYGLNTVSGDE